MQNNTPAPQQPNNVKPIDPNGKPLFVNYVGAVRYNLADWLLGDSIKNTNSENPEYEGYDGFYNNIAVNDLGAIGEELYLLNFFFMHLYFCFDLTSI